MLTAQMRRAFNEGEAGDALEFARRLRKRINTLTDVADADAGSLLLETGTVEALCRRPINAIADFTRALRLASSSPELRNGIALHAAVVNAACGRIDEATRLLGVAADAVPPTAGLAPLAVLTATLIAVERLDADAEVLLDELAECELVDFWPYCVLARVRWELAHGSYGAALNQVAIADAEHEVMPGTIAESALAYCRSAALTSIGHPRAAIEIIDSIAADTPELLLMRARATLHLGDDATAQTQIDLVLRDETTGPIVLAEASLIKVWIADRAESSDVAWSTRAARHAVAAENVMRALTTVPIRIASMVSPTNALLIDIPEPVTATRLRSSQLAVLRELHHGGTLEEIAGRLQLSVHTVRTHAKAIYKRLDVHTRDEAVSLARAIGLLT
ncbi:helix-turn-helix transcriptional regulator [Microbacterium shaanxiense]